MNNDDLQSTLSRLIQSGSGSNPAYTALLHDYTVYHAVLVIEGGMLRFCSPCSACLFGDG